MLIWSPIFRLNVSVPELKLSLPSHPSTSFSISGSWSFFFFFFFFSPFLLHSKHHPTLKVCMKESHGCNRMLVIFLTFPSHPSSFSWLLCKAAYLKPSLQISLYYSNKKPSTSTGAESEPKRTAVLKSFDRMHFLHFLGRVTCWKSLFKVQNIFQHKKLNKNKKTCN